MISADTIHDRPLRVGLYEPDPIRAEGFQALFGKHAELHFVPASLPGLIRDPTINLALIGIHGGVDSSPVVTTLRGLRPAMRILLMGPSASDEQMLAVMTAGAKAYLEESATPEQIVEAISIVQQGSIWMPRRVLSQFVERAWTRGRHGGRTAGELSFTARERQVLRELVAARSNPEIARILGIDERTVKAHVAKLMRKVGVENRVALSIYAASQGIVPVDLTSDLE